MSDSSQLALLLEVTFAGFLVLTLIVLGHRAVRIRGPGSARFVTVNASTNLSKKIKRIVGPGVDIFIPVGQGRYPLIIGARLFLGRRKQRKWENRIAHWIEIGASVIIIISSPNTEAIEYWQHLVNRLGNKLKVVILDRTIAPPEDAIEISRLDTFHPILIVKADDPLGMWVEGHHPPNSTVAYNVQYFARKDIIGYQRERFSRFLKVLRRLTNTAGSPPHIKVLTAENGGHSASEQAAMAA